MRIASAAGCLVLAFCAGCSDPPGGMDAGPGVDAGPADAGGSGADAGPAADAARADAGATDAGAAPPTPREALAAAGFDLADATLEPIDLEDCCMTGNSCSGNNPSSPYLTLYVPRGPGQTVANFEERPDGTSPAFRMREDEAIVLIGTTPPSSAYFGFTPYLFDRDYGATRRVPFASLSETLNHETIGVDGAGVFSSRFAMVLTGNATTEARVRDALVAAGLPTEAINLLTLDPRLVRFGLDDAGDTVGMLGRVALFDDPAAGQAWVTAPGAQVLRVSPSEPLAADPLPSPPARPKDDSVDETAGALAAALDRLEAAIRGAHAGDAIRRWETSTTDLDPEPCITNGTPCLGDNRDAVYTGLGGTTFTILRNDSVYVIGVDHTVTGKATYASASLYALSHLVGVAAVTSADWAGSAERFLPGDPDASSLFAWRLARDCAGDPYCLEVPTGMCPDGAGLLQLLTITFRAYVEPGTATAPDPALLVPERVLHLRP